MQHPLPAEEYKIEHLKKMLVNAAVSIFKTTQMQADLDSWETK